MIARILLPVSALALALSPLHAQTSDPAAQQVAGAPAFAFEDSDIPVDPVFRFGKLANGMRYVVAHNERPEGTALVRFWIGSGSLSETEEQLGLAHFLEHMAFNGSAKIPEGEMIKLLEREGLQFGADTNASTGFERTLYKLDLPRNDPALLDTALMLMRETASELTIDPEAVDRERGIVISERRDGLTYARKAMEDSFAFTTPGARYTQRLPIGTLEVLENGSAQDIRDYYEREYVPANSVLLVIGDFDPAMVQAKIEAAFSDWQAAPAPAEPATGPVDFERGGEEDIYLDPALSERVTIFRNQPYVERKDSAATRRQDLLANIGYDIVNRRLRRLQRSADAPFRSAGFGTGDIFKEGRTTNLIIDSADGEWRKGLDAAIGIYRQAMSYGFSEAEVAEQVARRRSSLEDAAAAADTRSNGQLMGLAIQMLDNDIVPSSPASTLARFEKFAPYITPAAVLAALRQDAAPLDNPLIRFTGRSAPEGGEAALRAAWNQAVAAPVEPPKYENDAEFAYQDFGQPGTVVSDTRNERFGFREIRFDNGVMLTLKQTDIEQDRIRVRMSIDGGKLIDTKDDPLKTAMLSSLPIGGLGKHTQDELDTILAGRTVSFSISAATDSFVMGASTTPRDLELQLQILAAAISDPGYRPEGNERYAKAVDQFFANLDSTPRRALGNARGAILSDGDPRFSLQPREAYGKLDFAKLRNDISDRLRHGALELALVGDFDEDRVIDLVAATLGTLPQRETAFLPREQERVRSFTSQRERRIVTHTGEDDQTVVELVWPTTDDSDLAQAAELRLLDAVVSIRVQEELRERLGQAYSPSAYASLSSEYPGYGTFIISASVDLKDVEPAKQAIEAAVAALAAEPVDPDLIDRARRPILEGFDNRLKSLASWIAVIDRAQSEAERLRRFDEWPDAISEIDGARLQQVAKRWLIDQEPVEIIVLPESKVESLQKG